MGWIQKHWRRAIAVALLWLLPLWQFVHSVIMLGGDADFVISRSEEPGWVGVVLNSILNPPAWLNLPMILAGLALIYLSVRKPRTGYDRAVRGGYPAKLKIEFAGNIARRLENIGVYRFVIVGNQPMRPVLFLAFERDTGLETISITSNKDGRPLAYSIIDKSDRTLAITFAEPLDKYGFTFAAENTRDTTKPLVSAHVRDADSTKALQ